MATLEGSGSQVRLGVSPLSWTNDVLVELGGDRVVHIHLKDVRREVLEWARKKDVSFNSAVREGIFTVPGDGCIDFSEIGQFIKSSGYSGWVIVEAEQDPAKAEPRLYTKKAYQYVKDRLL